MRRNRNIPRGSMGSVNLNMSGGPLLTEHLKDIDLELELLKRKREMIEQQQFLQPFNQQRNYNQQQYSYNQSESSQSGGTRDFSHLYNEGPQQYRKPFAKKRQSDPEWVPGAYPKRSPGQGQRGPSIAGPAPIRNQRPFSGPNQHSKPFKSGQGKQSIGQKIANQGQKYSNQKNKFDKKFVANKVTKPTKAVATPNNIQSQPVATRNDLVAAAINSVAQVEGNDREAFRLLPDIIPTKQMTGRLELALGALLREIREKCAGTPHEELYRPANVQRLMKQNIRERIRSVMLGKIIGATTDIIIEYRAQYPKETDMEIVTQALEEAGIIAPTPVIKEVTPIDKITPKEFFTQNIMKLIDSHLREMFTKMDEIYNPPAPIPVEDFTEDNIDPKKEKMAPVVIQNPKDDNSTAHIEEALVNLTPADYKRLLPRLLKWHIPAIIRLLNTNKMYKSTLAELRNTTREMYVEYGKIKEQNEAGTALSGVTTDNKVAIMNKLQQNQVLPYYVKVMGKPQLPKKKLMQAFLNVFNPKSIKKHRTIHNLLFIGFSTEEDFKGIVKADGTVIGHSTLSIRVCDKSNEKPQNKGVIDLTADGDSKKQPLEDSDTIGEDLEGQINDLLSSIRQTEEGLQGNDAENIEIRDEEVIEDNKETQNTSQENKKEESQTQEVVEIEYNETEAEVIENNEITDEAVENGEITGEAVENNETTSEVIEINEEIPEQDAAEQNGDATNEAQKDTANTENQLETEPNVEKKEDSEAKQDVDNQLPIEEKKDQLGELKTAASGRSTPTRTSSRLANAPTPSSIRTRRSSKLVQN